MTRPLLAGLVALVCVGLGGWAVPAYASGTDVQRTWHADQARVTDTRDAGRNGSGVIIAVLDSWVDRGHPDFEGRVLPGADCLGGTCTAGPASRDQCDHGTHVSGTVAASSYGVAPDATVLPVRVLAFDAASGDCTGNPDDVAAGITWAVEQGAQVLNLSLGPDVPGLSSASSITRAVEKAAQEGALVVFSAGNASLPVTDTYGGSALIVAATGPSGRLASYSQRGLGVTLAAPGGDPQTPGVCQQEDCVTSLFPGGRYAVAAGTSMAAPHVSGVAALLIGQDPARTRQQVIDRLLDTAAPLAEAGSGLVDARAALGLPEPAPSQSPLAPTGSAAPTSPGTAPTEPAPTDPAPVQPDPTSGAPAGGDGPPMDGDPRDGDPIVGDPADGDPTTLPAPAVPTSPPSPAPPGTEPPGTEPPSQARPNTPVGAPRQESRQVPIGVVSVAAVLLILTAAGAARGLRRRSPIVRS